MTHIKLSLVFILAKDYLELCKPKVVLLMLLTATVGILLASESFPAWQLLLCANLGIGLSAGSAASVNHLIDRHIDAKMRRTQRRPIASGRIQPKYAIYFSCLLGCVGLMILFFWVNALTAFLTALTLMGYAGMYTLYLKRATPQNIVIGGLAGAAPPLLGWSAVSNTITAQALLLVLIIYTWTPPHFWALAIYRYEEYRKANIPMLPVTHGIPFTKLCILLYTVLLYLVSLLPYLIHMCGLVYLLGAMCLSAYFFRSAWRVYRSKHAIDSMRLFRFSISYLNLIFILLLLDHYLN